MIQPESPIAKFIDSLTELISRENDPTKSEIYTQMLALAKATFEDIGDLEEQFDRRVANVEQELRGRY